MSRWDWLRVGVLGLIAAFVVVSIVFFDREPLGLIIVLVLASVVTGLRIRSKVRLSRES